MVVVVDDESVVVVVVVCFVGTGGQVSKQNEIFFL